MALPPVPASGGGDGEAVMGSNESLTGVLKARTLAHDEVRNEQAAARRGRREKAMMSLTGEDGGWWDVGACGRSQ